MTKVSNNLISSIWFRLTILGFLVTIIFILNILRRKKDKSFYIAIKQSRKEDKIEVMDNVVNSIFHSKNLYDTLKVKCHPDRFNDDNLKEIANDIFQIITENKGNFTVLQEIKTRATNELKIKF